MCFLFSIKNQATINFSFFYLLIDIFFSLIHLIYIYIELFVCLSVQLPQRICFNHSSFRFFFIYPTYRNSSCAILKNNLDVVECEYINEQYMSNLPLFICLLVHTPNICILFLQMLIGRNVLGISKRLFHLTQTVGLKKSNEKILRLTFDMNSF